MELATSAERERKRQSSARCEIRLDGDAYVGILGGEGKREQREGYVRSEVGDASDTAQIHTINLW